MVEGPGCKLNGEKLVKIKGQRIKNVGGKAASDKPGSSDTRKGKVNLKTVVGETVTNVETLGKELFIYCGQYCIRVHFLMNGSLRFSAPNTQTKTKSEVSLTLQLNKDFITIYESAVDVRNGEVCHNKFLAMQDLDICSSQFSFSRAAAVMSVHVDRMVCDVLLDQEVLPGVGNIIKNEALFDSGLHPSLKVSSLNSELVTHLLKMTRDFSMLFYQCRKTGKNLSKYYKVYKKEICRQCSGRIITCRLGENGRMTYFCQTCQTTKPESKSIRLPSKNSLIGWVKEDKMEEWTCSVCTLINPGVRNTCDACCTPRHTNTAAINRDTNTTAIKRHSSVSEASSSSMKRETFISEPPPKRTKIDSMNMHSHIPQTHGYNVLDANNCIKKDSIFLGLTTKAKSFTTPPPCVHSTVSECGKKTSLLTAKAKSFTVPQSPTCSMRLPNTEIKAEQNIGAKRMKRSTLAVKAKNFDTSSSEKTNHEKETEVRNGKGVPVCPQHNKRCAQRKVFKKGENHGRPFFVCSMPRDKQCNFFKWGDLKFPVCSGHGKRCKVHTVLKLGPNNGRIFYTCSLGKGKQCGFFQWAEET